MIAALNARFPSSPRKEKPFSAASASQREEQTELNLPNRKNQADFCPPDFIIPFASANKYFKYLCTFADLCDIISVYRYVSVLSKNDIIADKESENKERK